MIFIGIIVILIGLSIILEGFFGLPLSHYLGLYWPSILLVYGFFRLFDEKKSKNLSLFFMVMGLIIQLNFLKIIRINIFEFIFAMVLILIGFNIIASAINKSKRRRVTYDTDEDYGEYYNNHSRNRNQAYIYKDFIDEKFSFTSENIKYVSNTFSGGNLKSSFANVVIDLSQVKSITRDIDLNIDMLFSEVVIILPDNWHIVVNGRHYYGANEDDIDTILTIESDEKASSLKIR